MPGILTTAPDWVFLVFDKQGKETQNKTDKNLHKRRYNNLLITNSIFLFCKWKVVVRKGCRIVK